MPANIQSIIGSKLEPFDTTANDGLGFEVTGTGNDQTVQNPYVNTPATVLCTEILNGALPAVQAVFIYDRVASLASTGRLLIHFRLTAGVVARLLPIADKG